MPLRPFGSGLRRRVRRLAPTASATALLFFMWAIEGSESLPGPVAVDGPAPVALPASAGSALCSSRSRRKRDALLRWWD